MFGNSEVKSLPNLVDKWQGHMVGQDRVDPGATMSLDHPLERAVSGVGGQGPPFVGVDDSEVLPPAARGSGEDEVIGVQVHVKVSTEEDGDSAKGIASGEGEGEEPPFFW